MQEVLDSWWWCFPSVPSTLQFHQNILLQSHALGSDHKLATWTHKYVCASVPECGHMRTHTQVCIFNNFNKYVKMGDFRFPLKVQRHGHTGPTLLGITRLALSGCTFISLVTHRACVSSLLQSLPVLIAYLPLWVSVTICCYSFAVFPKIEKSPDQKWENRKLGALRRWGKIFF